MSNKIYPLFIFLYISFQSMAQVPSWRWAKTAGGNLNEGAFSNVVDASGNSYFVGSFESTTLVFGTTTLTCAGIEDYFIVKYDPSGNVLWAKSAGGAGYDGGAAVTLDATGNVYVTGYFSSPTITFGSTTLSNSGGNDIFIVKYNSSGVVQLARKAGGGSNDKANSIAVDANGSIFLTGAFSSLNIYFAGVLLTNANNTGSVDDMFIAKYDASGNPLWAKNAGGIMDEVGKCVKVDASGNAYVTGYYYGQGFTLGSFVLANTDNSGTSNDIFIAKYSPSGTVLWARKAGGFTYDEGYSIAVEAGGVSYITGLFDSQDLIFGTVTFPNQGGTDIYVIKYDSAGKMIWAKTFGGTGSEAGACIVNDGKGKLYISGYFDSPAFTMGATSLTNVGSADVLIAKLDTAGTVIWAKSAGGAGSDIGNTVAVDGNDNLFLGGLYNSATINFGTISLTNTVPGKFDIYMAKMGLGTGVNSWEKTAESISIYPNPGTGPVQISSTADMDEIRITNSMGQQMYETQTPGNKILIDLNKNGIYFVTIVIKQQIVTRKIIIQN